MPILGRYSKQPGDALDYDVDYTEWFSNRADAPLSFDVVADAGITIDNTMLIGNVVRVTLSGGTSGRSYKITVRLTTNAGVANVKEADFVVRVKEV